MKSHIWIVEMDIGRGWNSYLNKVFDTRSSAEEGARYDRYKDGVRRSWRYRVVKYVSTTRPAAR